LLIVLSVLMISVGLLIATCEGLELLASVWFKLVFVISLPFNDEFVLVETWDSFVAKLFPFSDSELLLEDVLTATDVFFELFIKLDFTSFLCDFFSKKFSF
jgi:hypothetical protein